MRKEFPLLHVRPSSVATTHLILSLALSPRTVPVVLAQRCYLWLFYGRLGQQSSWRCAPAILNDCFVIVFEEALLDKHSYVCYIPSNNLDTCKFYSIETAHSNLFFFFLLRDESSGSIERTFTPLSNNTTSTNNNNNNIPNSKNNNNSFNHEDAMDCSTATTTNHHHHPHHHHNHSDTEEDSASTNTTLSGGSSDDDDDEDDQEEDDEDDNPSKRIAIHDVNVSRYHKEFVEVSLIGRGVFGSVYLCRHRLDGCLYAIKRSLKPVAGSSNE